MSSGVHPGLILFIEVMAKKAAIKQLLEVMARLRAPDGCPWDREQDHKTLRMHAVEEVYELLDAIDAEDDHEMQEELGDVLLQVVFHCQLAQERGVFDFEQVAQRIVDKLIHRHPHVFGDRKVKSVDEVWANWEKLKREEKQGTHRERPSAMDGIPKHLPALQRSEKLVKKAKRAGVTDDSDVPKLKKTKTAVAKELFELARYAQSRGWSAEQLLRGENRKRERAWRRAEKAQAARQKKGRK